MLRQFSTRRILAFFLLDWLGTLGMFLLATWLRSQWAALPDSLVYQLRVLGIPYTVIATSTPRPEDVFMPQVMIPVAFIWPVFLLLFGVYDGRRNAALWTELRNVALAIFTSAAVLAGLLFFSYRETSRTFILIFVALDMTLLWGARLCWYTYRRSQNSRHRGARRNVLVVGAGQVGMAAVEQLERYAWADLRPIGYADDDPAKQARETGGLPVLGTLDQLSEIVLVHQVSDVIVALPLRAHERLVEVCRGLQKLSVNVHIVPDLFALSFPSASLDGFGGIPVINLGLPSIHGRRRHVKRAFDTILAAGMLVLLSPLLLLTALLIKLESTGPVIYRQQRIGENGCPFTMLKFRSMRANADTETHRVYAVRAIQENLSVEQLDGGRKGTLKMVGDPRITRVGKFIRKTSIDELPQLWNVLRGEMSLVGPRPPLPYEVAVYQDWHKRRLEAIPGITGLWQVKGRNRVSFDEMVRMDLEYVERQSFWLDIKILVQTPWQIVTGRGAG